MNKFILLTSTALFAMNISKCLAESCTCTWSGNTLTITDCANGVLSASSCTNQKSAEKVIIGTGITNIGDFALMGANSLSSITISEGVTSIGTMAFCCGTNSLNSITIPEGVTSIGTWLFYGNTSLKDINCAGTENQCNKLEEILNEQGYLPPDSKFNVVTPIAKCSFYTSQGCNACYSGYAFGNGSCHDCGTGKKCHWDKDEGVVFDGCEEKYLRKGSKCISASDGCGASFRLNDGECDRIRYTPAEAAEVLKDTDNQIIMTFKVNR